MFLVILKGEILGKFPKKKDYIAVILCFEKGGRSVSNRRPPEPQSEGFLIFFIVMH